MGIFAANIVLFGMRKRQGNSGYIWERTDWPRFRWDNDRIMRLLERVNMFLGKLTGRMEMVGLDWSSDAALSALTEELLGSSEIEGGGATKSSIRTKQQGAYWDRFRNLEVNERQRKIINRLWDGFDGKLTSSKWAKICHCSWDTALSDINDLISKGMLRDSGERGAVRTTSCYSGCWRGSICLWGWRRRRGSRGRCRTWGQSSRGWRTFRGT